MPDGRPDLAPAFVRRVSIEVWCANPTCPRAGQPFRRPRGKVQRAKRPSCSLACAARVHSLRDDHARRCGGRILRDGYAYVKVHRTHHLADSRGYAPEHLVVAERVLGRSLARDETVRRLGYDAPRSENPPERLFVLSPRGTWRLLELAALERAPAIAGT